MKEDWDVFYDPRFWIALRVAVSVILIGGTLIWYVQQ
jgi:hypothetical protein